MRDIEVIVIGKHSCGESRITCIDCGSIICSKCLVQCPVGFRCSACGNVKNPLTALTPFIVAKSLIFCGLAGFLGGWTLPFIGVPFFACILAYFLGIILGRILAKLIDYRMGRGVGTTIVFGVLIGMSFSPYGFLPFAMAETLSKAIFQMSSHYGILDALTDIVASLFVPVGFIVGIMRPTVWGERF